MPEPLIPDDVRATYEALIAEGSRILTADGPDADREIVRALSDAGLALVERGRPLLIAPTSPSAAFARLLARWHVKIGDTRDRLASAASHAIAAERVALRVASRRGQSTCALIVSPDHVAGLQTALSFGAEQYCKSWATGPYGNPKTLPTGEPHHVEVQYFAPQVGKQGARHLVVYDRLFLEGDQGLEDMSAGYTDGEEIRLTQEQLPMKLLIVDDDAALVPLGAYGNPCLLIHEQSLVKLFAEFFELKWTQATPWAPPGTPILEKENTQQRRILNALAEGLKDEAIARQQGISVRTVRRHIAALMEELGVTTRFAAGVAAVRRGWLSPTA